MRKDDQINNFLKETHTNIKVEPVTRVKSQFWYTTTT